MSEENVAPEVEVASAEVPAPEQEATAAPAPEEQAPEKTEEQKPKSFTQEEVDALIGKRLAREQRKWEREHQQRPQPAQQQPAGDLKLEQFATPEEYAEALAERKAAEKLTQVQAQQYYAEVLERFSEQEEAAIEKYGDYEQVVKLNQSLQITPHMADVIRESDIGADIAYFLGTNPKEAARIARLNPFLQAKEIGRLEAKLADAPPTPKKTTAAPPPISPVTPRGSNQSYDTTDPRSVKTMSTSEWIAAENARLRRKLEAANR